MAFMISVHRRSDDAFLRSPPPHVDSPEFDAWFAECNRRVLYENPLGSDGAVYEFWHLPAQQLGLALLAQIYEHGLCLEGEALVRCSSELDSLEWYWNDYSPIGERLSFFREAIRIARECDGVLDIG